MLEERSGLASTQRRAWSLAPSQPLLPPSLRLGGPLALSVTGGSCWPAICPGPGPSCPTSWTWTHLAEGAQQLMAGCCQPPPWQSRAVVSTQWRGAARLPAGCTNTVLGTGTSVLLMPRMPLPTPVFSSEPSSALSMFCQSSKHVFRPVRVNRKLPASGLFVSLGTQTAARGPKVGPVPRAASPAEVRPHIRLSSDLWVMP